MSVGSARKGVLPPLSLASSSPCGLGLNVASIGKLSLPFTCHPDNIVVVCCCFKISSPVPPFFLIFFFSYVMSEYGRMTDTERDQIDQDAQTFMRTCSEAIQQLRTQGEVL